MKTLYAICVLSSFLIVSGCGVQHAEYDKLNNENIKLIEENERLMSVLDECENGAEKLIAKVEKAYAEQNYPAARLNINMLKEKHPESAKNEEFKALLNQIEKDELAEQKRQEARQKERIRLANIDNTGMWSVRYYVDEFGEPTKDGYISNTYLIEGTFSNTATQNSPLNVRFLISTSSDISIQLYEYAGNNPVKAYSSEIYRVLVQDNDGTRYKLSSTNFSDRLRLNKPESRKIHNILMKGGEIKFRIYETDMPTTEYEFTISNADWYENAYAKLKE